MKAYPPARGLLSCHLLVVAFVWLACSPGTNGEQVPLDSEVDPTKTEAVEALERFREGPEHRLPVLEKVIEAVDVGMAQADVQERLGPPDTVTWSYGLFYSSALGLVFDKDERLISRVFDIIPSARHAEGLRELSDPEVQEAGVGFRSNPFNRQEPAAVLLSVIEPGMEAKDIAPLVGEPDAVIWEYDLVPGGEAHLSIGFDPERRVTAVNSFGE